jgi:KaiC/GvpD/RAD55 family RecA-like ATPase
VSTPFQAVPVEKLPTGIPGFDHLSGGGLPRGRTTLVSGATGTGKTLMATERAYRELMEGRPMRQSGVEAGGAADRQA